MDEENEVDEVDKENEVDEVDKVDEENEVDEVYLKHCFTSLPLPPIHSNAMSRNQEIILNYFICLPFSGSAISG